jgi:hypothetical protein
MESYDTYQLYPKADRTNNGNIAKQVLGFGHKRTKVKAKERINPYNGK